MSPLEPSYPSTAIPKYSNTDEGQDEDNKPNFMKTKEFIKEEMNIKKWNIKE